MKITDINGREITVTDLNSAWLHVNELVDKLQTDDLFKQAGVDIKLYWLDIQTKLETLKTITFKIKYMANYCSNCIRFECSGETLAQIKSLFNEMASKEEAELRGQIPHFIQADKGFMYDIYWNEDVLFYETRWCPNIEIITAIADHFQAGFTYTYDEMGNLVYGQAIYQYGILTDISLELPDFEEYNYSEETDKYSFEGKEYENDYEILEILLERKKKQMEGCKFSINN